MPVLLDLGKTQKVEGVVDMSKGVPLMLGDEQRQAVVMTKYVAVDPHRATYQPAIEEPWFEQVTADVAVGGRTPRITIAGKGGDPRRVAEDDSLIIDLQGTMTRTVGIVAGLPPMSEEQVEGYLDQNPDAKVERFYQWDFRVSRVLKTNGLEARMALLKSEDQKRQQSQADMFAAIAEAFAKATGGK